MIIKSTTIKNLVSENTRLSQGLFPELISMLVKASVNKNGYIRFPSGDAIFTTGVDGILQDIQSDNYYVPQGNSVWELGTNKDGLSKIKKDYNDRKKTKKKKKNATLLDELVKSEYSYVAVTSSILDSSDKQAFCDNASKDNVFKKVYVLDANDISSWLEQHIEVAIWFLKQYGKDISDYDILLLKDEWDNISSSTSPSLTFNVFKVGNGANSDKLINDIKSQRENKIYNITSQYYGRDFSYFFTIASLMSSSDYSIIDRCIIVNSQSALNYINAFCKEKIVLVNFNCLDQRFISHLENTYIFFDILFLEGVNLNFIQQNLFVDAVKSLGFPDSEAYKLSYMVDYNLLSLKRVLSKSPFDKIPQWSKNRKKNELIPLLLLGEINLSQKSDVIFLKQLVGNDTDNYTETLNLWTEISPSPILKYSNTYKICSRKESFDYIQIDMYSIKLKKLEKKLIKVLSEINNKYKKDSTEWYIEDGSYIWGKELLKNIFEGFVILSTKNQNNQFHFDSFVKKVFDNLYGNYELSLTIAPLFYNLAEISPKEYLNYLKKSIKTDKENFIKVISTESKSLFTFKFVNYIVSALYIPLKISSTAIESIKLLLDIYNITQSKEILNEIKECLSPISTKVGNIAVPLAKKIEFFFSYIQDKDTNLFRPIVEYLHEGGSQSIAVISNFSYRNFDSKIDVTYDEIFNMENVSLKWLLNSQDHESIIVSLKGILNNMHTNPKSQIEKDLMLFKDSIPKDDDIILSKIQQELIGMRGNIIRFENWGYLRDYIPLLDELIEYAEPEDEYIKNKYILFDNEFPLLNPPLSNDENWYHKEDTQRQEIREKCLKSLLEKYGQDIITKIIQDIAHEKQNVYAIWPEIYKLSNNHEKDLDLMIEKKLESGLAYYLSQINEDELKSIITIYDKEDIVIKNLPFNETVFRLIDGNPIEKCFWENKYPHNYQSMDFELIFNKFLKFAPYKLIDIFAYNEQLDYEHSIKLLKTLSENVGNSETLWGKMRHELYGLQTLIEKMDKNYYNDELSLCEFNLLSLLISSADDYPLGIKKYFWDHPDSLGQLLVNLYQNKDKLNKNSLGYKIFNDAFFSFGNSCYIPNDYLYQKKDKIKVWVENVLKQSNNQDDGINNFLKKAVIKTLVCCPKIPNENIWPIREIADILENLANVDEKSELDVSIVFYCGYINRRGVRSVGDGSVEFEFASEFTHYQDFYKFSHPVTSKALEHIANSYRHEGESDQARSFLGHE